MSLARAINAYDAAYRALGNHSIPAGPAWDADVRRVDGLGEALLNWPCNTVRQYRRWIGYIRRVSDLSHQVDAARAKAMLDAARAADLAKRPRRPFDDPQPTYEVGIDGTDRIKVVPPKKSWGRYHKRYPFDVMEIGETVTIAHMKNRAEIGATLNTAERQHHRWFTTTTTPAGLRIERVSMNIKPCVECNAAGVLSQVGKSWIVRCPRQNCDRTVASEPSEREAVRKWNARTKRTRSIEMRKAIAARKEYEALPPDAMGKDEALRVWRYWQARA